MSAASKNMQTPNIFSIWGLYTLMLSSLSVSSNFWKHFSYIFFSFYVESSRVLFIFVGICLSPYLNFPVCPETSLLNGSNFFPSCKGNNHILYSSLHFQAETRSILIINLITMENYINESLLYKAGIIIIIILILKWKSFEYTKWVSIETMKKYQDVFGEFLSCIRKI